MSVAVRKLAQIGYFTIFVDPRCKKKYVFIVNLDILYLEFFTKLQNFGVLRFLVKVFEYCYISVTINGIAFIFHIQLPKDLGNTLPGYFCKTKYFFIVNLGVLDLECFYKIIKFLCFEIFG